LTWKNGDNIIGFVQKEMNNMQYTSIQRDVILDWADKWFELSVLIVDITSTDEPPFTAPVPTDTNEINYQRLRFWLKEHEAQFVAAWQDFYVHQEWAIKDASECSDDLIKNPFSYLYTSENLYHLAKDLELQSGIDIWEPLKARVNIANGFIIQAGKRLVEFINWMDEKVHT
jgi:hypothetical protein